MHRSIHTYMNIWKVIIRIQIGHVDSQGNPNKYIDIKILIAISQPDSVAVALERFIYRYIGA